MEDFSIFDKRFKYRLKEKRLFYIFKRNKQNNIYYVRFKNGKTISTGKTSLKEAFIFAQVFFNTLENTAISPKSPTKKISPNLTLSEILQTYYTKNSSFSEYDIKHGTNYTDSILKFNHSRMLKIEKLLSDVIYPKDLSRPRLIKLQDELLQCGLSGKTVNNYFSIFHKIFCQLLDKDIIKTDPFTNLKPCSYKKEIRLCFPLSSVKGVFSSLENKHEVLSFVACSTGMRRSELERIELDDFTIKNGTEWIKVRGTKSVYSVREVPVFPELKNAIIKMKSYKYSDKDFALSVLKLAQKIGFSKDYIKQNGIKFHSFRKLYKTLLTQSNLNTTLIESLMGHTTHNQLSNDVERTYFVSESADLSKIHSIVCKELKYLI